MKRALISVSDKEGIIEFVAGLIDYGFEIISTGGTAKVLTEAGFKVIEVSELTNFPEMLDGRVKTLHPYVHGAILAKDSLEHMDTLAEHSINPIDMVVVNLYPFERTISKTDVSLEVAIENIDVGGPTMIRAAAKNHSRVAVVVDPADYGLVLEHLKNNYGNIDIEYRKQLALRAFQHTANYDATISAFFQSRFSTDCFPKEMSISGHKIQTLRYGENPHQSAAFYRDGNELGTLATASQLGGKELSYNNIVDLDAAWQLVNEFQNQIACAIIKHTNPCGVAVGSTAKKAYIKALEADSVSAFGGIVAINTHVDIEVANKVVETFIEAIIAPTFSDDAIDCLKQKPNLRILETKMLKKEDKLWIERISGGFLLQERDRYDYSNTEFRCVTKRQPTQEEMVDLLFACNVAKHVKSNAIVVAKNNQTLGIGAGQMNRVGACAIAFEKAGEKISHSVLASDAFFPFRDSIDKAAQVGIKAIIQPGGSVRDQECIIAADEAGIAMIFTGARHFKH